MNGQDDPVSSQGQTDGVPMVRLVPRPLATWPRVTWLAVTAMLFSILVVDEAGNIFVSLLFRVSDIPVSSGPAGIGVIVAAVVALILGLLALVRIRNSHGRYDGYFPAIYAIVVSALVLLGSLVHIIKGISGEPHEWSPGL